VAEAFGCGTPRRSNFLISITSPGRRVVVSFAWRTVATPFWARVLIERVASTPAKVTSVLQFDLANLPRRRQRSRPLEEALAHLRTDLQRPPAISQISLQRRHRID